MVTLLSKVPRWWGTAIIYAAILWLTLSPHPLPDTPEEWLFPGADKVCHGLMFAALCAMLMLDLMRGGKRSVLTDALLSASVGVATGILTEVMQMTMALGRSLEPGDMIADGVGAMAGALGMALAAAHCRHTEQNRRAGR